MAVQHTDYTSTADGCYWTARIAYTSCQTVVTGQLHDMNFQGSPAFLALKWLRYSTDSCYKLILTRIWLQSSRVFPEGDPRDAQPQTPDTSATKLVPQTEGPAWIADGWGSLHDLTSYGHRCTSLVLFPLEAAGLMGADALRASLDRPMSAGFQEFRHWCVQCRCVNRNECGGHVRVIYTPHRSLMGV